METIVDRLTLAQLPGLGPRGLQSGDLHYALRRSRVEDLLWNRTTADRPHSLGVTVVYGHTPRADF